MKRFIQPPRSEWQALFNRPALDQNELRQQVRTILEAVRTGGMAQALAFSKQFDGYSPDPVAVSSSEIADAASQLNQDLQDSIKRAARNIEIFHRNQLKDFPVVYISRNIQCWQRETPIAKVGFYIPGGSAPLFSTVLMLGIPAMIAGCEEMILCTPPDQSGRVHPAILYAASLCGINRIYKLGGVQAIGAMAYGVGEISSVDKIYGPGNQYVTMAKQLVNEDGIAIDMPAGPSEVLVIADEYANPAYVAADLLSQAEHGPDSQVVLVCQSVDFADQVEDELNRQVETLPRAEFAKQSLQDSLTIIFDQANDMMEFSNGYAPEHLIISTADARAMADRVKHAGSVFIGSYTPESAGDYASGTNHTLPTNGYARSYSGLSLQSFMKTIQFQEIQKEGLLDLGPDIIRMANAEGLAAHSRAVEIRLQDE